MKIVYRPDKKRFIDFRNQFIYDIGGISPSYSIGKIHQALVDEGIDPMSVCINLQTEDLETVYKYGQTEEELIAEEKSERILKQWQGEEEEYNEELKAYQEYKQWRGEEDQKFKSDDLTQLEELMKRYPEKVKEHIIGKL